MFRFTHSICQQLLFYLLLGLSFATPTMAQEGNALSLAEYQQQIQHSIKALEGTEGEDAQAQLREAQEAFASISSVIYPSKEIVSVGNLLEGNASIDEALARLKLVNHQLDVATKDHSQARLGQLTAIFERPEFNVPESLWQRFRRWVGEWLDSILPERDPNAANSGLTSFMGTAVIWIIAGLGAILTIFLLSYWLQGLFGSFVSEAERKRREQAGEAAPLTATVARKQAHTFAQTGNYRQAVRQLYLSALLTLEEKNMLQYDRSLTNREVLGQIGENESLQQHLQPVVDTFDDVWYGIHEPDAHTFSAYQDEIDSLSDVTDGVKNTEKSGPKDQDGTA